MEAAAVLDFQKIRNFTARSAVRSQYASPCQISSKIGQTIAEIWRFNGFQNGGRPPSWICWAFIGTTHDDHLKTYRIDSCRRRRSAANAGSG